MIRVMMLCPCPKYNDARIAAPCPENLVVVVDDVGGKDRQEHEHLAPHRSLANDTGGLLPYAHVRHSRESKDLEHQDMKGLSLGSSLARNRRVLHSSGPDDDLQR